MKNIITQLLIIISFVFVTVSTASAQQDARYTQYMFNGLIINPAYAGSAGAPLLNAFYRNQWVNIEGAPKTISASGHTALGSEKKVGVGGFLEYDKLGVETRFRLFGAYAYRFDLGHGHLSAGIQGGFVSTRIALSEVELGEPGDPTFNQGDISAFLPNFGLGLYYNSDKAYAGISVPHLINNKVTGDGATDITRVPREERHYFLTAGAVLGEGVKLKPSFLVKLVPNQAPTQFDINLNALFKDVFWIGSSFRFEQEFRPESLDFLLGFQFQSGLMVGYAYDITLSDLNQFTSGSHEITLGYDLGWGKGRGIRYRTPRFF